MSSKLDCAPPEPPLSLAWSSGAASLARAGRGFKNSPDVMSPSTVLGSGKTQELVDAVTANDATLVVFLNSLRAAQAARLAALTRCEVIAADSTA